MNKYEILKQLFGYSDFRGGQEILVELVAGSTDNGDGTLALDAFFYRPHRRQVWRTAGVAGAIVMVGDAQRALIGGTQQLFVLRQVLIVPPLAIVETVSHHDAAAVDTLPQTHRERIPPVALIKWFGAPHQFLRGKTDKSAMCGQSGEGIGEAETIGQEDVGAFGSKFPAIKSLSEKHVSYPRLRRADDALTGIPTAAGDVPSPGGNTFFQFLILKRVILFHPGILYTSLEIEDIIRILPDEEQILVKGILDVFADSGLHVPVPLGIQVGIGHEIHLSGLFLSADG